MRATQCTLRATQDSIRRWIGFSATNTASNIVFHYTQNSYISNLTIIQVTQYVQAAAETRREEFTNRYPAGHALLARTKDEVAFKPEFPGIGLSADWDRTEFLYDPEKNWIHLRIFDVQVTGPLFLHIGTIQTQFPFVQGEAVRVPAFNLEESVCSVR